MHDQRPPGALLVGATGRMGREIAARAATTGAIVVSAHLDRAGEVHREGSDAPIDVVVDFSVPDALVHSCAAAVELGAALLVGTTGLDFRARERLDEAARTVAVMEAPNTSLGIAALRRAVVEVARMLPAEFAIDLVETHHEAKRDRPSGTALRLAEDLAEAGRPVEPERIHAVRSGDAPGEHVVRFTGQEQTIRLEHVARSRSVFAAGAVHAAAWLAGRPAGRYAIEDALVAASRPQSGM